MRNVIKQLLSCCVAGLCAAALLPVAAAQAPAGAAVNAPVAPVTLSLRDVPLRTALETLFTGTGLQHAIEPAVPNYPITLDVRDLPFSTALRTLMRLAPGVTYRKEGDIYIIGMRQPPIDPTAAAQDVQPLDAANAPPEYQYVKLPLNFSNYQVMASLLGGQPIPTEAQVSGGGSSGIGGGIGGASGGYGGGGYGGGGLGGGGFGGGGGLGGFGGGQGGGGYGGGGFGGGGQGGFGGGQGGFGGGGQGGFGGGGYGGGGQGGGGYFGPTFRRF
jgi:hypothetical protein